MDVWKRLNKCVWRKGKMMKVSLDYSNSFCICVNVKDTGPHTPNCWCLSCILTSIGENLQIHVTLQLREALLEYRYKSKLVKFKSFLEGSVRNLNEVCLKMETTLFKQESLNLGQCFQGPPTGRKEKCVHLGIRKGKVMKGRGLVFCNLEDKLESW